MPITNVTIENFKGIGERVEIPLRPITLLFGANSAGKSTILQALLYLRELLDRQNADADRLMASGASIDLGGFCRFVHGHDLKRKVRIGVDLTVDQDGLPAHIDHLVDPSDEELALQDGILSKVETAGVEVTVEWDSETGRPWITGYEVRLNGMSISKINGDPGFAAELTWFNYDHPVLAGSADEEDTGVEIRELIASVFIGFDVDGFFSPDLRVPLRAAVLPEWGRKFSLPIYKEVEVDFQGLAIAQVVMTQIFVGVGDLVLQELRDIRHIGSFRDIPERKFNIRRSPSDDRWANGAAAWDLLYTSDLKWFDDEAFNSLGLGYEFDRRSYYEIPADGAIGAFLIRSQIDSEIYMSELESLAIKHEVEGLEERQRLQLLESSSDIEVDPCDVGVGVSQVTPVVIGAMAPGYSILSVEQPELHIHPAVQCALADVLAKEVIDSTERCLLLETHSEHLMLRWLRRIREWHEEELPPGAPAIKPEHVSVLYVESCEEGQRITELPITEDGDFAKKWPRGFFDERADELF